MPNLNYDLLITQTKQSTIASWIKFKSNRTDDLLTINNKSLYIELSKDLYIDKSLRTEPEEDNSNDKFYDAELGFNFIYINPLEYRLFVDNKKSILPVVNVKSILELDSYIKISLFDLEVLNNKTNTIDELESIDIIIPIPIVNKKIYILSSVLLNDYNFNINYYEDSVNNNNVELVFVNIPISKSNRILLQLYKEDVLISETSSNYYSQIIPSLNFSVKDNVTSKLEDIVLALGKLFNEDNNYYSSRLINGLYNTILSNSNNLPENINKDIGISLDSSKIIKNYCLLLFILGINLNSESTNFTYYKLIEYLKKEINNSLSIRTKNLIYGYDTNLNPYQFEDFSLLFLGYLSLSISQEFSYDEESEYTLSILLERINILYTYNYSDINKFDYQTVLEGIFWASLLAYYQNNKTNILKLVILYKFYKQSFNLKNVIEKIYNNLIIDIFQHFEVIIPLELNIEIIEYENIGDQLYQPKDNINISLLKFSSLINLIETKWYKNYNYNYLNLVNNALYYRELFIQYYINSLPYGISWFSDNANIQQVGVLGSIIKGLSYGALLSFIKYYSNLNKIDINKAQGIYLNAWGDLVSIPRLMTETDLKYRTRLIHYLTFKGDNIKQLTLSLKQIDPDIKVDLSTDNQNIYITTYNNREDIIWLVGQLNFIGAKIILKLISTIKIQNKNRGLYAGSNNYS